MPTVADPTVSVPKISVRGLKKSFGRKTVLALLNHRPAEDIVGLVRDPAKAEDLKALGVELRQGDYLDRASLTPALAAMSARRVLTGSNVPPETAARSAYAMFERAICWVCRR